MSENNEFNKDEEVKTEVSAAEEMREPTEEEIAAAKAERKKHVLKELREWGVSLLVAFVVVFIVKTCLFMPIRVDGKSMYPTLDNGEMLGVTVFDVKFLNDLNRNDVVICHYPDRGLDYFVKRLVGLPGDTVKREHGVTFVNDVPLDIARYTLFELDTDYEYVLGEDEYFVVGDNRYNSHDSRTWQGSENAYNAAVGPISKKMIVGHARFVMFPFKNIRSIESVQFDPQ